MRRHVAGAHDAGRAVPATAAAYPDASSRRSGEASSVVGIGKRSLDLRRPVQRTDAQVGRNRVGIDDLSGIHFSRRIPYRLELAESLHEVRSVHLFEQRRLCLSVAVLARKRSVVFDDQIRPFLQKPGPVLETFLGAQIKIDPAVHQPISKMTVDRRLVSMPMQQRLEITQVSAEFFSRYGSIFPAFI